MTNLGGVYEIVNKKSGNKYIGSSVDIKRRWEQHKRGLRGGYHYNIYLQNAWNKYGKGAFEFRVIAITEPEEALRLENLLLATPNYAYNIARDAVASLKGVTFSEEHKRKIGDAHRGKILADETKRKISENHADFSGKNHPNYGKHPSEETLQRMSECQSGERSVWYGRNHLEKSKRKTSKANRGANNYHWIDLPVEELKLLKNQGYSYTKIGEMFSVSRTTIRRRILGLDRVKEIFR